MSNRNPLLKKLGLALLAYIVLEGLKIAIAEQHELSQENQPDTLPGKKPLGFDSAIDQQRFAPEFKGQEICSKNTSGLSSPNNHLGSMTGEFARLKDGKDIIQIKDNHGNTHWKLATDIKTI